LSSNPPLSADLPTISGDPSQLPDLFLNLLANALDALGPGGVLRVAADAARSEDDKATVRVTVHDTGAGIPAEMLPRVFDPFFITRAASGGTGLGLAIVRRIVRDHGGSARLESAPERGTRVIVELPTKTDY
jgi:two-component system, NtrC family, sensor kinase